MLKIKAVIWAAVLCACSFGAGRPAEAAWGGWENLGGVILEQPNCVSWGANRIDCFARGTDAAMYHRWWNGSSWGGWENLGGIILEEPDCVSWSSNRIDCFARGTNWAMYHRWWNGSSWGGWENLGGVILEAPDCVSWGPNRIDCFARGTDAAMYHRWWNGSSWGGWENLGGVILEEANCVSWGSNRIDCFARGSDRAMYHRWWSGGVTSGVTRSLTISRHTIATLSNADVDSLLTDASGVLQTDDGDDISCDITLIRSGGVGTFATGDGSLDTSAELQAVFALAGNVKVVDDVNFCAGMFNTSYIGCGQTPGTSFITERFTANQEGILWAHEFGHNQGLPHRDTSTNNVMYFSIGTNRRNVNNTECDAFRGSSAMVGMASITLPATAVPEAGEVAQLGGAAPMPETPLAGEAMSGEGPNADPMPTGTEAANDMPTEPIDGTPMAGEAGEEPLPPVEEFVTEIYFDGLPLDKAAMYGEEDVPALLAILNDPSQVLYHENAALTLGMIGSESAVTPLIAYIERGLEGGQPQPATAPDTASTERAAYKGRVGATMALGYIANLARSERAVDYLIGKAPSDQGALETAPAGAPDEQQQGLRKYAIIALGFSASDKAKDYLRSLRTQGAVRSGTATSLADEVDQSLEISDEVSRTGLVDYYSKGQ